MNLMLRYKIILYVSEDIASIQSVKRPQCCPQTDSDSAWCAHVKLTWYSQLIICNDGIAGHAISGTLCWRPSVPWYKLTRRTIIVSSPVTKSQEVPSLHAGTQRMFPMMAATTLILVLSHFLVPVSATLYNTTCHQIAGAISPASDVYYPSSQQYSADISHFVTSSTQSASCSVEPGTAADVGVIVRYISISQRMPTTINWACASSGSLVRLARHSQWVYYGSI